MSQKTNLNISPYYDDFDSSKNFLKVLFKPGYPIQSRELTTLQSILQNQVQEFGTHMFKEGSVVIPGNLVYDGQFYAVKLNAVQSGVDVSLYVDKLVGKTVTGDISGITAKVQKVVLPTESDDVEYITLYVKYLGSDENFEFTQFVDGETLSSTENIVYGNTTIVAGSPFASAISSESTAIGSAASIGEGVYFIRGYFVKVAQETILLDYYTNTPSYRVGLQISETIVNAKEDESLYDNAKGFSNFASPGADRLKISLSLSKRDLTDTNDTNFVELLRIRQGKVKKITTKTSYNLIRDYLAERTFDESGNYTVRPFDINLENSLNDRLGNNGTFLDNEKTDEGNVPSDDLASIKISEGKAYISGYDIPKGVESILDVEKPRDTDTVKNVAVPFNMGNILRVNTVTNVPAIRKTVDLYGQLNQGGVVIGQARVYSFNLTDAAYADDTTSFDLRLYDIQTYTDIVVNKDLTVTESDFVKGKSSGATGFVTASNVGARFFVRQTSGNFAKGEQLIVNGVDSGKTVVSTLAFNTQNIKSVKQTNPHSTGTDFTANSILESFSIPLSNRDVKLQVASAGVSTMTMTPVPFTGISTSTIVRYQKEGQLVETFNKVKVVGAGGTSLELEAIASVAGVFDGTLVTGSDVVTRARLGAPIIRGNGSLFAELPEDNTSSIDLSSSQLYFIDQITGKTISGNTLTVNTSDLTGTPTNSSWVNFDQERFTLTNSSGVIAPLSSDAFSQTSSVVTIKGLTNSSNNVVNVTALKSGIQSKTKNYDRSRVIFVSGSKLSESGSTVATTKNDGLTYVKYYGLRVQDEEVSLNYPDVAKVVAIYESLDTGNPTLDVFRFPVVANVGTNAIIGENIIGSTSGAVARIVSNNTTTPATSNANDLGVVYLNSKTFTAGETIKFEESNITTTLDSITPGSYSNITTLYKLNRGQKREYYDYSRIVRNKNAEQPSRRLMIVFDHYTVPSNDDGDVFTVNSYDVERFASDIPNIGGVVRASDTLDFRPRVATFNASGASASPFDFVSRTSTFNTIPVRLLAPDEQSVVDQTFYLPRIDKVFLDKNGKFIVKKGESAKDPKPPQDLGNNFLELGVIEYPAYLYDPSDALITLTDSRRYTMRDIGDLENRVESLEKVTTLSLLEVSAQTLQVRDADGNDRFKSGFFVKDFSNATDAGEFLSTTLVDEQSGTLNPNIASNSSDSLLGTKENTSIQDLELQLDKYSTPTLELFDENIQKTGEALTLKYDEVDWLEQSFATKVENVNPFQIVVYDGVVELFPEVDSWTRTVQLADRNVNLGVTRTNNVNLVNNLNQNLTASVRVAGRTVRRGRGRLFSRTSRDVTTTTGTSSSSSSSTATGSFDTVDTTIRNEVVGTPDELFMRSRNYQFKASNLKPNTRYYQFINFRSNVDVVPKLLEISPNSDLSGTGSSGAFLPGETVVGSSSDGTQIIRVRVSTPNEKIGMFAAGSGSFLNPRNVFDINPYSPTQSLGSSYSSSSSVLNIDTASLARSATNEFSGYVEKGTLLVGQTSGAVAYVKDIRLITDNYGDVQGTFFIRDPHANPTPEVRITTGTKTYRLSSSSTNDKGLPGSNAISFAEANFTATASLLQFRATVTSQTTRTNISSTVNLNTNLTTQRVQRVTTETYADPLAQTFTVGGNIQVKSDIDTDDDVNGVFLTSVDLFFATVDSGNAPLRVEVRTTELGTPTLTTIGKPVILTPFETINVDGVPTRTQVIQTSSTGEVATNVRFPEPIFLAPGAEYAIVLVSDQSDEYEVWTAVMGEKTVNTQNLPNVDQVIYSKQFALGSLFKSQNGSIWTTDQNQDMKFKLYKAEFAATSGTAYFYNSPVNTTSNQDRPLSVNPIRVLPKTGRIGIVTTTNAEFDQVIFVGRKLAGVNGRNGSAIVSAIGGPVTGVTLTEAGANYPASVTNEVVSTYNITGKGQNLKVKITTDANGVITGVTHDSTNPNDGSGYQEGDVVGIQTSTTSSVTGRDAVITINAVTGKDTLYLTNVQGEFGANGTGHEFAVQTAGSGIGISYYSDATTIVAIGGTHIISSEADGGVNTGEYLEVEHYNHGMYSNTNKLVIDNIRSDIPPTRLSATLASDETTTINVVDSTNFATYEGVPVSSSNKGLVKIGDELILYQGTGSGTLTIANRGALGTKSIEHSINKSVEKYEIGGVSLSRISGITTSIVEPIEIDRYHLKIDRTNRSTDGDLTVGSDSYPQLSFNDEKLVGGDKVSATQNFIFDTIIPSYNVLSPGEETNVSARIRTITATSVDGTEVSFNDNGFERVQINQPNALNSVRMIASDVNEREYLTALPRNKSLTTAITFDSTDENKMLSPILYLDSAASILNINRVNKPITDFTGDNRVNSVVDDPHASVYYSEIVNLENPADSLKVIIAAERPEGADFRVLYTTRKADSAEIEQSYELFPGYDNLKQTTEGLLVVDESKNSGLPDRRVSTSRDGEFLEYEFTANNLDLFNSYGIKIVVSGTNQAATPRFTDLRVIAIR
jgi:hypothetical protein